MRTASLQAGNNSWTKLYNAMDRAMDMKHGHYDLHLRTCTNRQTSEHMQTVRPIHGPANHCTRNGHVLTLK